MLNASTSSSSNSRAGQGAATGKPMNPLFVTTSAAYGMDIARARREKLAAINQLQLNDNGAAKKTEADPLRQRSFPFLYRRTSDEIGKGIRAGTDHPSPAPSSTPPTAAAAPANPAVAAAHTRVVDPAAYLRAYQHQPKTEHPLYTTSQNAIGAQPPSQATIVLERRPIPQDFSNSFNGVTWTDQSLNCAPTRSKVHKALDPL